VKTIRWWHPVGTGLVALASGVVPYLALTAQAKIPAGLRDNPWPFEVLTLAATAATVFLAVRAYRQRSARAVATVAAVFAVLDAAALLLLVHVATSMLPAAPQGGLAVGALAPDFTLPDETGAPVALASMRGHPTLIIFYRGHW
jgi:hypothetical protein